MIAKSYRFVTTKIWFYDKKVYTTNTTFYYLFIPMTNKNIITWLVIVWVITAVWLFVSFVSNTDAKKELSDKDVCYGSGATFETQVTACGRIIKESQKLYPEIEKALQEVSNNASGARNQISKLAKDFYSTNLSGTNVDFQ